MTQATHNGLIFHPARFSRIAAADRDRLCGHKKSNYKHMKLHYRILMLLGLLISTSCQGFLDEKPTKSILVPESVPDFEALLDGYGTMNLTTILPFMFSDDYWTSKSNWQNFNSWQQRAYLWDLDPYLPDEAPLDYSIMYRKISYANVTLDKLNEDPDWLEEDKMRLKGKALFWRASAYFELAVLYLPMPSSTLDSDEFVIPMPSTADINAAQELKTSEEVFTEILNDLQEAILLLPIKTDYATQPSLYAGYGLLARISLYLGNYSDAATYAKLVLDGGFTLMDYQDLDFSQAYPSPLFNSETILFTFLAPQGSVSGENVAYVDSLFVKSFDSLDLRSKFLFENNMNSTSFKGSYTGNYELFTGVALDEIYLILAEAHVRLGDIEKAKNYLDILLASRIVDYAGNEDQQNYLKTVLEERRKTLLYRGQRWADLKRFSYHDGEQLTLRRYEGDELVIFEGKPENFQLKLSIRERNLLY